ncbi:ATP-dependent helicase [Candidatus Woesearchaeota archaeon]|nr:MAG: ATP-dependent helicase [Candidatus Woesearchaeota archaeon]
MVEKLLEWKEEPDEESAIDEILNSTVKQWFKSRFKSFSLPQRFGVREIHSRNNVLISAPTGSTKTLTGFLSILNELVDSAQRGMLQNKVYVVYVSPLKALSNDISKNLKEPLEQIEKIAGKSLGIRIGVRTGDTNQKERSSMLAKPPHILITTPESLAIMLASPKFREHLKSIEWCIIDEIHALAENKRGVHLSLTLERIERLSGHLCRVGLSATVSPLEDIARYLVGCDRPCKIIDVTLVKKYDFKVISPVDNLIDTTHEKVHSELYKKIDELIQQHRTTLIFTNTRAATERVVDHLKHKFPGRYAANIGAHHASMSKSARWNIEQKLRAGELKAVVCSTSLELGLDIGYIDLVICLSSPKSVARFLQRAGRSGHKLHERVKARIIVMDRDDLVECAVLLKSAIEKNIDKVHIPNGALDVLAQHIIGACVEEAWDERELYATLKRSWCYKDLTLSQFNKVLSYLSGEYAPLEDRHVYAKIWRENGRIGKRGKLARMLYMTNIGTIPDESHIIAKIGKETIGILDEGFVERLKPGDVFVLGGNTYIFKYSKGMVAQIAASANRPPTIPSWFSEMLPLSFDLALEIGRLRRLMLEKLNSKTKESEIMEFLHKYLYVDDKAARAILSYFKEQYNYCKAIPSDKQIIVEYTNDGLDDKIVFHTLFGRKVNDCLSRAIAYAIGRIDKKDVSIGINDNGFWIRGNRKISAIRALKILRSDRLGDVMRAALERSEVLRRRFRHCATRAFMILRNYKGKQKRVGRQQVGAQILLSAVKRLDDNFSILEEARRECLEDLMDIENAKRVLENIESGKIRIKEIQTKIPSPFALNLALQGYMDVLRIEDKYEFLRRMHEQIIQKIKGEDPVAINCRALVAKSRQERKRFKDQLCEEARKTELPIHERAEIIRIIEGERSRIDPALISKLKSDKIRLPEELSKFLKSVLPELKVSEFSYEEYWKQKEREEDEREQELKLTLILQFREGARIEKLNPQIVYDVYKMIDGEREGFREETIRWLNQTFSSSVPKHWKDDIAKFLIERKKDIA